MKYFLRKKLLTFITTFNVEKLEVFDKFDNLKLLINFSNLKIETCIWSTKSLFV